MQATRPVAFVRVLISLLGVVGSASLLSAETQLKAVTASTVEILSVPSGLRVYLSPDTGQASREDDGGIPIVGSHSAVTQQFLKGVTPLLLPDVSQGQYLLAIAPVTLISEKVFQPEDPLLDARVFVSANFAKVPPQLEGNVLGAAVYSLSIERARRTRVIVLAVPWDAPMEQLAKLYPASPGFAIDEAKVASELKRRSPESHFALSSEANLRTIVDLLRRGGKAWLHDHDLGVVAALRDDGEMDFAFMVRLNKLWRVVRQ